MIKREMDVIDYEIKRYKFNVTYTKTINYMMYDNYVLQSI